MEVFAAPWFQNTPLLICFPKDCHFSALSYQSKACDFVLTHFDRGRSLPDSNCDRLRLFTLRVQWHVLPNKRRVSSKPGASCKVCLFRFSGNALCDAEAGCFGDMLCVHYAGSTRAPCSLKSWNHLPLAATVQHRAALPLKRTGDTTIS